MCTPGKGIQNESGELRSGGGSTRLPPPVPFFYHKGLDWFRHKMGAESPGGGKDWKLASMRPPLAKL